MSPLWPDEVAIFLSPRRLVLVRRTRGLVRRVVATAEHAIAAGTLTDPGPVFAGLAEVVSEPAWHGAVAQAIVADPPWVRYAVVPWPATRLDAAGRLEHARYVLADAYGDSVADWVVTLADGPPGRPYLACAMPPNLRSTLEDTLAPARLKLVSLQPRLVMAFNAWRHQLPAGDGWFATVDEGSLAAVHLRNGAWNRVHLARLSQDWNLELERLQSAARLTLADGPGRLFIDAPPGMRGDAAEDGEIEWLEGPGGEAQPHELVLLERRSG